MNEWKEYTGSNEQIAEMQNSYYGFLLKLNEKIKGIYRKNDLSSIEGKMVLPGFRHEITHYLICNPHPLADMIIRQAQTVQPVFMKIGSAEYAPTTTPNWNIPNAEYSFTPFED